jgi:hypothetical protein
MEQKRVPIQNLKQLINEEVSLSSWLKKIDNSL